MAGARRVILFMLGVYLLIYAVTVHPVQIAVVVAAFMLMGVITWDQMASMVRRDRSEANVVEHPPADGDEDG